MSVELDQSMPVPQEAVDQLAVLLNNAGGEATTPSAAEQREAGADRAGADASKTTPDPIPKPTDTRATPAGSAKAADAAAAKTAQDKQQDPNKGKTPEELAAEKKAADDIARDPKGRYAKTKERLDKTWEGAHKLKGELDTRDQQLTQREQALKQREAQIQQKADQSQAQHKPEDYERAGASKMERAKALHLQADGLDAKAQKAEDDGKYVDAAAAREDAKKIRKAAHKEEGNAEDLKAHADHLRKNPPASIEQQNAQLEGQRKEWLLKAAQDFPELGKKDSELQKAVAGHLNALWQSDRALASLPQIVYHVTRLATAETAAARVPGMEKELGELRAKVKDYEVLTSPGGRGSAQTMPGDRAFNQLTADEQQAELSRQAAEIGVLT